MAQSGADRFGAFDGHSGGGVIDMAKHGKKFRKAFSNVDRNKTYAAAEAVKLVQAERGGRGAQV